MASSLRHLLLTREQKKLFGTAATGPVTSPGLMRDLSPLTPRRTSKTLGKTTCRVGGSAQEESERIQKGSGRASAAHLTNQAPVSEAGGTATLRKPTKGGEASSQHGTREKEKSLRKAKKVRFIQSAPEKSIERMRPSSPCVSPISPGRPTGLACSLA